MTTTPNVDDPEQTGEEVPTSISSEKGKSIEAPQGSQEFLELKKKIELQSRELKGLQSRQDKEKNEVQRFMDEVKEQVGKGLSIDEAEQVVTENRKASEKDDLLYRIAQKLGLIDAPSRPVSVTKEAEKVLAKAGVNANDPAIAKLCLENSDPVDLAMKIGEYKAMLASKSTATAADASSMSGKPPSGQPDVETLTNNYVKEMRGLTGGANALQRERVKGKYSKLGVDIYNVDFT